MFENTIWWLRGFGLAGILGAILFMAGDLSYNHIPGSKDSPAVKMSRMPEKRLIRAGVLGLVGGWLYALASLHLYMSFLSSRFAPTFGFGVAAAFIAIAICYSAGHAAYYSIASGAKAAVSAGLDVEKGASSGNSFFKTISTITYVPAAVFTTVMIYAIWTEQSRYPFWMVFFVPTILYFLKALVVRLLRGRAREVINDCYDNFVLFIFFLVSTIVLWNGGAF